jgi:hypothetical protein
MSACNSPLNRFAFRQENGIGTQKKANFAAQWLAYAVRYQRFADALTDTCARLGADVVCYSFIAADFHHLLLAGLLAHAASDPKRQFRSGRCMRATRQHES